MTNLLDTLFEYFLLILVALIAVFVIVAFASNFVDTGLFQVDHTAQTVDTFQRFISASLSK